MVSKVPITSQSGQLFLACGYRNLYSLCLEEDVYALGSIITRSLVDKFSGLKQPFFNIGEEVSLEYYK